MKKIFQNKEGQAIFEFIIFIPFLVFLYTIFYTVGNSINGSINQQKQTRGYYYNLVKNSSYQITNDDLLFLKNTGIKTVGFFAIAFREKNEGENSQFAPCFQFSSMIKGSSQETCDGPTRQGEGSSSFVRVFTAYGICGAVYITAPNGEYFFDQGIQGTPGLCKLMNN